jgi:hypothetical protein
METNQLLALSPSQLRRAADIKEQIDRLNGELESLLEGEDSGAPKIRSLGGGRRQMSAEARKKIAEAARVRWAKYRAQKGQTSSSSGNGAPKTRRQMSPVARKKIAAAQKARWAKIRAAK